MCFRISLGKACFDRVGGKIEFSHPQFEYPHPNRPSLTRLKAAEADVVQEFGHFHE